MSDSKRKVGFYSVTFQRYNYRRQASTENDNATEQDINNNSFFDINVFRRLLTYISNLNDTQKIIRNERTKKAVAIEVCEIDAPRDNIIRIIFKSCKYNHSPNYMSSVDGSERPSNKAITEGEKEKTHLCALMINDEAKLVLEERQSGVTMGQIVLYLNSKLKEYMQNQNIPRDFKIIHTFIPSGDFRTQLNASNKIKCAEIFTHKMLLGSEAMNIMDREDSVMKDEITITVKAKPKEGILRSTITNFYNSFISTDSRINRIRVYATNNDNNIIKIDTNNAIKCDYITAQLDENGIVDSPSFLVDMVQSLIQEE